MRTQDTEQELVKIQTKKKLGLSLTPRENAIEILFGVNINELRRTAQIER